jgi:hypothetical protein
LGYTSENDIIMNLRHGLNLPEFNIIIFAFLLNFVWEVQQMPFFLLPPSLSCQERVINCTLATVGDVAIMLTGFWVVAALVQSRRWILQPSGWQVAVFLSVGIVITAIFEVLATGILNWWEYASIMPTLPGLGTGLLPLLQWLLLPLLVIYFLRRQLQEKR